MNGLMFVPVLATLGGVIFLLLRLRADAPEPARIVTGYIVEEEKPRSYIAEDFNAMGRAVDRIWPFHGRNAHEQDERHQ